MSKIMFITGATSGIGEAIAHTLADKGHRLILCGRRIDRLETLKKRLSEKTAVRTLSFDVRDKKDVASAIASLDSDWQQIDVLVNNAGNAHGLAPIDHGDLDDWDSMIDINIKGLLYVTKAIVPRMVKAKKGHIINIGSIAGKEVYANGNVYCASKHAVDAINKAMLIDLNEHGIRVCAVNPGMVDTEFSSVRFKGDKERAESVYKGLTPLQAQDIAEIVEFVISRPVHVKVADITVFPTAQGSATTVKRN